MHNPPPPPPSPAPYFLTSPLTIRAKMLFQELWQRGFQWEDRLDDDIADQWRSWKSKLSQLSCITVPRYFMGNIESRSSIVIHGFGDASTHLAKSKARVAPTKTVPLPGLELLAALTNARLLKFDAESLTLKTLTLQWIRGSICQWKTFVASRVAEIQSTRDP